MHVATRECSRRDEHAPAAAGESTKYNSLVGGVATLSRFVMQHSNQGLPLPWSGRQRAKRVSKLGWLAARVPWLVFGVLRVYP